MSKSIALVTELYPPAVGGSAVLFYEIYRRLVDCSVTVITEFRTPLPPGPPIIARRLHASRWGLFHPAGVSHYARAAFDIRRVASPSTHVVHCGRALPEGFAAGLGRLSGGAPYVCWVHGEELATFRSSRELTMLSRSVLRNAAALLANSRNTLALLEREGHAPERIHVVHPGVDPGRFRPDLDSTELRRRHAPRGEILLLSVGRLQKRKGHDMAIKALARVADGPLPPRYLIVGDGEERSRLAATAEALGVASRVDFVGEVDSALLPLYYAASDIFIMPNRSVSGDIEGFGIVFLEAAAAGRPTIGGRSGGVAEAIADGQTGILVNGEEAGDVARAIVSLSTNKELRGEMGDAGRRRVLHEFTWERAADGVREVHNAVSETGQL